MTSTHTPNKIPKNGFLGMRLLKSWPTSSWMLVCTRWADCSGFNRRVLPISLCKSTPVQFTWHIVHEDGLHMPEHACESGQKANWSVRKMCLLQFSSSLLMWPRLFLIIVHLWHAHGEPGNLWAHALDIFPSSTFIWMRLQDIFFETDEVHYTPILW